MKVINLIVTREAENEPWDITKALADFLKKNARNLYSVQVQDLFIMPDQLTLSVNVVWWDAE